MPRLRPFLFALCWLMAMKASAAPVYDNLVDVQTIDPTIRVDLRYAGPDNIIGRPLYLPSTPALVRPETAARLAKAQAYLRSRHYGLKIWDAYRPLAVQMELWSRSHDGAYVADPESGNGSLHTWGVAVDVTLVDEEGRDLPMPTKFDEFTPAAHLHYQGSDPVVQHNLKILQNAMGQAGFYGMRTEWWHFIIYGWKKYAPIREAKKIRD